MRKKEYSTNHLTKKEEMEFALLVKENMKRAYFSALGILGNHDLAMEVSQEAFLKAMNHFDKFDRSKKFFTWYYKILRNLSLNKIRDEKNRKQVELLEIKKYSVSENDLAVNFEKDETAALIEEALMKLEPNDREILILKEFENYSYKEIAELLELPLGSVMSRLFYARKKLAKALEGVEL
ncbi:MAG: RNA polymerase sigma factor [Melioribacteraceae bacterium]|nr:RNA polymerase sigma factor [Melioribacteraceae bacterium]MCO6474792.1 RNA polymerase sigma factor [Melioribacteraceae bacterium]